MKKDKWTFKIGNLLLSAIFVVFMIGELGGCSKADTENKSVSNDGGEIIKNNAELDDFDKIHINVDAGNVQVIKGNKYAIESEYNNKTDKLTYEVKSGKLEVKGKRTDSTFKLFDFGNQKSMEIKIYVPDDKIDELNMEMGSGNSKIDTVSGNNLWLKCGAGNVEINNSVYDKIDVETESGNFDTDKLTCNDMKIENSSGNISCSTLKTSMLNIKSSSGNIDLDGELKGKNNIRSSSGNINIKTSLRKSDYSYDIDNDSGRSNIDGESMKGEYKEDNIGASNSFNIECSSGDTTIKF